MDEFRRRIVSEAILWSGGIVGFATFGYGFLEGSIDAPYISMIWVLPCICLSPYMDRSRRNSRTPARRR